MKHLIVLLFTIIVSGCGDNGVKALNTPPKQTRPNLHFGYYGDCGATGNCYPLISHATLMWIPAWYGTQYQIDSMRLGIASGIPQAMLFMDHVMFKDKQYISNKDAIRDYLNTIRMAGLLTNVKGFYPIDEPDLNLNTPTDVAQAYIDLRSVMSEYPELALAKIAVIYNAGSNFPGLEYVDWTGIDNYDKKELLLIEDYPKLIDRLRFGQELIIVPGGASPWQQDPVPFYNYAQQNTRVAAIVAFAYLTAEDKYLGIGFNGMLPQYTDIGNRIKGQ